MRRFVTLIIWITLSQICSQLAAAASEPIYSGLRLIGYKSQGSYYALPHRFLLPSQQQFQRLTGSSRSDKTLQLRFIPDFQRNRELIETMHETVVLEAPLVAIDHSISIQTAMFEELIKLESSQLDSRQLSMSWRVSEEGLETIAALNAGGAPFIGAVTISTPLSEEGWDSQLPLFGNILALSSKNPWGSLCKAFQYQLSITDTAWLYSSDVMEKSRIAGHLISQDTYYGNQSQNNQRRIIEVGTDVYLQGRNRVYGSLAHGGHYRRRHGDYVYGGTQSDYDQPLWSDHQPNPEANCSSITTDRRSITLESCHDGDNIFRVSPEDLVNRQLLLSDKHSDVQWLILLQGKSISISGFGAPESTYSQSSDIIWLADEGTEKISLTNSLIPGHLAARNARVHLTKSILTGRLAARSLVGRESLFDAFPARRCAMRDQ